MKEHGDKIKDEEETFIEDSFNALEDEIPSDEAKQFMTIDFQLKYESKLFKENEELQKKLESFKNYKVIKFGRFLQSLLYFLKFDKDQVVEKGTQKFFWKTAKHLVNQHFMERMGSY